jgi:S1-C subfamily serine protease
MILAARVLPVTILAAILALAPAAAGPEEEEGAWLGVAVVADEDAPGGGVLVAHVLPGGPAQEAGLEPEDLIRSVGGSPVALYDDLSAALAALRPGQLVPVGVVRAGQELVLEVELGERQTRALYYLDPGRLVPLERELLNEEALAHSLEAMRRAVASQKELAERYRAQWRRAGETGRGPRSLPLELWGAELALLTPELRVHFGAPDQAGFLVARVAEEGLARDVGVQVGDVLVQLGERPLESWGDVLVAAELARTGEQGAEVPLLVARAEGTVRLAVPAAELGVRGERLEGLPLVLWEGETRDLERRIRELEAKIRELEAALEREREGRP